MKKIFRLFAFLAFFVIAEDVLCQSFVQTYYDRDGREYTFGANPSTIMLYCHNAGLAPNQWKPTNWVMDDVSGIITATSKEDKVPYVIIYDPLQLRLVSLEYGEQLFTALVPNHEADFPVIGFGEDGCEYRLYGNRYEISDPGAYPFATFFIANTGKVNETYYAVDEQGDILLCINRGKVRCNEQVD